MNFAVVLAVVAFVACAESATIQLPKLPANHVACFRNDPEFDKCFTGSLQNLIRTFAQDGVAEIGVQSFDPLVVPEMALEYEQGQIFAKLTTRNTKTTGFSNIRILGVRSNFADPSKFEMEIDFQFPNVLIEGQYTAEGNLVVLPLNGGGDFNITMRDVTGTWKLSGIPISKKGLDFVKLDHFLFRPKVGNMKVYMANIFPGNEALSSAAVAFANAFWPAIYEELLPYAEQGWDPIMTNFANRIFTRVPFNELFPVL